MPTCRSLHKRQSLFETFDWPQTSPQLPHLEFIHAKRRSQLGAVLGESCQLECTTFLTSSKCLDLMACFCRASRRCRHVHGGRDWNANLHNQARNKCESLGCTWSRLRQTKPHCIRPSCKTRGQCVCHRASMQCLGRLPNLSDLAKSLTVVCFFAVREASSTPKGAPRLQPAQRARTKQHGAS